MPDASSCAVASVLDSTVKHPVLEQARVQQDLASKLQHFKKHGDAVEMLSFFVPCIIFSLNFDLRCMCLAVYGAPAFRLTTPPLINLEELDPHSAKQYKIIKWIFTTMQCTCV